MNIPKDRNKHWDIVRKQLWQYMKEEPKTMLELSKMTYISRDTLENFLYGDRVPEINTICRIMKFLEEHGQEILTSEE